MKKLRVFFLFILAAIVSDVVETVTHRAAPQKRSSGSVHPESRSDRVDPLDGIWSDEVPVAIFRPFVYTARDAIVTGERYLGLPGTTVDLKLGDQACEVQSTINIELHCAGSVQILWQISDLDDLALDEPRFLLLWAGDRDGDGRIDLEMDLSPKYSCTRTVLFLSSRAAKSEMVGIANKPETRCGV
jgi:hypothetical protein